MPAEPADIDLTSIHFGYCKMLIGYASIDGECISIGGCSRIAEGVDYSTYFYNSQQECLFASTYNRDECPDLSGDLNDDGDVDISDIVTIVNCILQENDCACADTNNDNTVDILDVVSLVNQILNNCDSDADNDGICDDQDCINENNINNDLACPLNYYPVCGCDGITYSNECSATINGVTDYSNGPCVRDMQTCLLRDGTEVADGWTGKDTGDNWCNSCFCNDGALGCTKIGCPPQLEPEAPSRDCIDEQLIDPLMACTRQYAPVCGCDEQTYSNACRAESAGLTSWIEGECLQEEECPTVCCYAMTASCLACSECQTVEEYCLENPHTLGCEEDATDLFG